MRAKETEHFSSQSRWAINSVNIYINRERELLLINEENNVSCVIPDFLKIYCLQISGCIAVATSKFLQENLRAAFSVPSRELMLGPIRRRSLVCWGVGCEAKGLADWAVTERGVRPRGRGDA